MRLPFGDATSSMLAAAGQAGYVNVSWSIDPRDWAGIPADEVVANTLNDIKSGSIIMFQTSYPDQKSQALPALIKAIRDQGFEIVPLTELLYFGQ